MPTREELIATAKRLRIIADDLQLEIKEAEITFAALAEDLEEAQEEAEQAEIDAENAEDDSDED